MAEDVFSVWNPLNYDKYEYPFHLKFKTTKGSLSNKQTAELSELIHQTRISDLDYLNRHLEVRAVIRELLHQITSECPYDVRKFVRKFFSQPKEDLCAKVAKHIEDLEEVRRNMLADDSSVTSITSASSKMPSSSSLRVGKRTSITMSQDLPKTESEDSTFQSSTSDSKSPKSVELSFHSYHNEYEFEREAEEEQEEYKCDDCKCLITSN